MLAQTNAQNFKETFDANSLEWTECAFESNNGTAVIDGGKMNIVSYSSAPELRSVSFECDAVVALGMNAKRAEVAARVLETYEN